MYLLNNSYQIVNSYPAANGGNGNFYSVRADPAMVRWVHGPIFRF
jgi:hypothetical protein